jgi:hypothetical protein
MDPAEVRQLLSDAGAVVVQPPVLPAGTDSRLVAAIRARHARETAHRTYLGEWARLLPDTPLPVTPRTLS